MSNPGDQGRSEAGPRSICERRPSQEESTSASERQSWHDKTAFKILKDFVFPAATAAVAVAAFVLALEGENRASEQAERAAAAEVRAHADLVVFQDVLEEGPAPGFNQKPSVAETYVVANFGQLPIEDVRVLAPVEKPLYGRQMISVTEFGTVGPCEVATAAEGGSGLNPYVVFTDANGQRWTRRPAHAPRPWKASGRSPVTNPASIDTKRLRNCQA